MTSDMMTNINNLIFALSNEDQQCLDEVVRRISGGHLYTNTEIEDQIDMEYDELRIPNCRWA